jgi:RNA polymerase sigma-70 factor (ECF subfamily)
LASHEDAAFEELVRRQSRFVFRITYAILRNSHDAEDASQETFLKLYRNRTWHGIENERAFLARAAWRIAVDRLPRAAANPLAESFRPGSFPDSFTELPPFEPASPTPTPEQEAIAADWQAAIHRMIDALPEELRQPLALSSVDALNSREIAVVLQLPEGTVRTRLMRARQILKQKMAALENARSPEGRYAREG